MRCVPQVASLAAAARGHSLVCCWQRGVGEGRVVSSVDNARFGLKLSTWNAIFQTVYFLCKFAYISSTSHTPPPFPPRCRQSRRRGATEWREKWRKMGEREKRVETRRKRNVLHSLGLAAFQSKRIFMCVCGCVWVQQINLIYKYLANIYLKKKWVKQLFSAKTFR